MEYVCMLNVGCRLIDRMLNGGFKQGVFEAPDCAYWVESRRKLGILVLVVKSKEMKSKKCLNK